MESLAKKSNGPGARISSRLDFILSIFIRVLVRLRRMGISFGQNF